MPAMEEGTSRTRLDPDSDERFVPLRRRLGVTTFGMNQIVLQPRERGRIHAHEHQEEVYLVLDGTLTLLIENDETILRPGELIRIAPGVRRQLVNRGPDRLSLLALGGAKEHEGRDGRAWTDWDAEESAQPRDVPMPPDLPQG
jgi:uncharacterized cupin superfamily protein